MRTDEHSPSNIIPDNYGNYIHESLTLSEQSD